MACDPNSPFSTYGNSKVTTYQQLAKRIAYQLGYPVVQLEIHSDAVYENISTAVEMFTKFAGTEEVYLIFSSTLYERKRGIYLPKLFANSVGVNSVELTSDVPDIENLAVQVKPGITRAIDTFSSTTTASIPLEYTVKYYDPYNGRSECSKFLIASQYTSAGPNIAFTEYGNANTYASDLIGYNIVVSGNDIKFLATANFTGFCEVLRTKLENTVLTSQIYNDSQTFTQFTSGQTYLIDYYTNDQTQKPVEYLVRFTDTKTGQVQVSNYLIAYKTANNSYTVNTSEIAYISTTTRLVTLSASTTNTGINVYLIPTSGVNTSAGLAEIAKNNIFPLDNTLTNRTSATILSGTEVTLDNFDVTNRNSSPYEYTIELITSNGNRDVRKWTIACVNTDNVLAVSGTETGAVNNGSNFGQIYLLTSGTTGNLTLSAQYTGIAYIYKNVNSPQRTIAQDLGIDDTTNYTRKVMSVFSWEQGTSNSLNSLFTIESVLAQQTYFSYAMGSLGFDLVSWHLVKSFIDVRAKVFQTKQYFNFNPTTQYLTLLPEPTNEDQFYGLLGCYVEKHFSEQVKEPWVQQYALALTKIVLGRIRSKYSGTQLFGGASMNGDSLISEGLQEKKDLEQDLLHGASAGFGSQDPIMFVMG